MDRYISIFTCHWYRLIPVMIMKSRYYFMHVMQIAEIKHRRYIESVQFITKNGTAGYEQSTAKLIDTQAFDGKKCADVQSMIYHSTTPQPDHHNVYVNRRAYSVGVVMGRTSRCQLCAASFRHQTSTLWSKLPGKRHTSEHFPVIGRTFCIRLLGLHAAS